MAIWIIAWFIWTYKCNYHIVNCHILWDISYAIHNIFISKIGKLVEINPARNFLLFAELLNFLFGVVPVNALWKVNFSVVIQQFRMFLSKPFFNRMPYWSAYIQIFKHIEIRIFFGFCNNFFPVCQEW